jgi:hypothetical protein
MDMEKNIEMDIDQTGDRHTEMNTEKVIGIDKNGKVALIMIITITSSLRAVFSGKMKNFNFQPLL